MYPVELEIKDTTESNTSASYLDLLLSIKRDGQLHTSIYDKSDDFNFHITNFPFLSSNIPTSPAYGIFISQQRVRLSNRGRLLLRTPGPVPFGTCICFNNETILSWTCHVYGPFEFRTSLGTSILLIRYARACSVCECFILRATRLSNKLIEQEYIKESLKSSLRKFYGRYGNVIKQYAVSLSQMINDILWPDHIQWQHLTDQTLYRTRPFTEFWVVSIQHLRRVWHADRGRLLLRTPGPVPFGLAYVLLVETNPFPNLSLFFRTMLFEYPSVLSRFFSLWQPSINVSVSKIEHRCKVLTHCNNSASKNNLMDIVVQNTMHQLISTLQHIVDKVLTVSSNRYLRLLVVPYHYDNALLSHCKTIY